MSGREQRFRAAIWLSTKCHVCDCHECTVLVVVTLITVCPSLHCHGHDNHRYPTRLQTHPRSTGPTYLLPYDQFEGFGYGLVLGVRALLRACPRAFLQLEPGPRWYLGCGPGLGRLCSGGLKEEGGRSPSPASFTPSPLGSGRRASRRSVAAS